MKQAVLTKSLNFITKYKEYSKEDLEKLKYGLEGIYLTVTKLVLIVLLSVILGIFREVIILLLLFNIIRYFGFGVHARKSSECLITSIFFFIILPTLFLANIISKNILLLLSILSLISFFLFAPADTVKRPFKNKNKRIIRKIMTIIVGTIYLISSLLIEKEMISKLLQLSIIIQAIAINPLTYKILKQSYNNYKNVD